MRQSPIKDSASNYVETCLSPVVYVTTRVFFSIILALLINDEYASPISGIESTTGYPPGLISLNNI